MTVLGHLQRGGTPTAADRVLGSRLGVAAADLAAAGRFGRMVALRGAAIVDVSLEEACAGIRPVPDRSILDVARALSATMTSRLRLAAIDLDGTLLRSDGTVSARSRAALAAAQAAGIEVVLVTARSPARSGSSHADLGIGGVATLRERRDRLRPRRGRDPAHHRPLQVDVAHRVVSGLRERMPGIAFAWELELRFGSEPAYEARRDRRCGRVPRTPIRPCDALEWREPMTKLLARLPDADL